MKFAEMRKSTKHKKLPQSDLNAVARLASMNYFPTTSKEGQKALCDAFGAACADKARVEQAVQHFLDEFDQCPTVHEIKAYCLTNHLHEKDGISRLKKLKEESKCLKCADHPGRMYVMQTAPDKLPVPGPMTICDCPIGQELKRIQDSRRKEPNS